MMFKIGNWNFLLFSDEKVSPIEKCKRIAETLVALITAIGFIPAGAYTAHEYFKQQQNRREDKTLELYIKQLEDPLFKSRINLNVFYDSESRREYLNLVKEGNPEKIEEFSSKFNNNKEHSKNIMILINYYEGVAKCVNTGICDREKTKILFKKDVQDFVVMFGPFFCNLRKDLKDPNIALDLENFLGIKPKNPLCNQDGSYSK